MRSHSPLLNTHRVGTVPPSTTSQDQNRDSGSTNADSATSNNQVVSSNGDVEELSTIRDDNGESYAIVPSSFEPMLWSSANESTAGSTSLFANRKKGYKPKGTTMSKAASRHAPNATTAASTNPSKFWIGTYYPTEGEQANYLETGVLPMLRLNCGMGGDVAVWRGQWEQGGLGDKAGKLHAQFAVMFTDKVRAPQARKILGNWVNGDKVVYTPYTGWLQVARSDSVWDYVKKIDTRVADINDFGEIADNSGDRSDLDFIYQKIASGAPIYEIMETYPRQFMRNHAAISKLCAYYDKPRPFGDCTVEVWWGVTGSGKSHMAFHEHSDAYRKSIPGKWWDGYKGETTVVMEEFNPTEDKEVRLPELLKLLDKYPYQVEIKGTSVQMKANKFIFTTNIDPRKWYEGHPQQPALHRRISKVKVFKYTRDEQAQYGRTGIIEFAGIKGIPMALLDL